MKEKRASLKKVICVATAVSMLPNSWSKPIVRSIVLPAHGQTSPSACGLSECIIPDVTVGNAPFGALTFDADTLQCSHELISFTEPSNSFLLYDNNVDALVMNSDSASSWSNDIPSRFSVGGILGANDTEIFETVITRVSDNLQFRVCFSASREIGPGTAPTATITGITISRL